MTRPVKCIFRLAADTGRSGVEGGVAASTIFFVFNSIQPGIQTRGIVYSFLNEVLL